MPSVNKSQHLNALYTKFTTSGLPPLITRRSTVTNNISLTRKDSPKIQARVVGGHRRFESQHARISEQFLPSTIKSRTKLSLKPSKSSYYGSVTRSRAVLEEFGIKRQEIIYDTNADEQEVIDNANGQILTRAERKRDYNCRVNQLNEKMRRQWLIKRGKGHVLDFHDDQIRKLRDCFNSLDADGSGAIGIEELEDPLIGLGFAETRQEVQDMIDSVDTDHSTQIEFGEFLHIIKGSNTSDKTAKINKFFKDMTSGSLGSDGVSFTMFVQRMRREYLKNAIMGHNTSEKEFGEKILKNVAKQFQQQNLSKPIFTQSYTLSSPRVQYDAD